MIKVEHITKNFGNVAAVNDVSFQVPGGKTLVLLGTSGSGKTTTLRIINRLVQPDKGSIYIDDADILSRSKESLRRSIGYVLQAYGLFPHYTVAQNIAIVPKLLGWSSAKINDRIPQLLTKLQLNPAEFMHVYPAQLSGGQKQRVGVARALAANPPILLMDEPFGALDPITRTGIRKEFKQLDELKTKTIVMVTHDIQEAFEMGDIICLMHEGKIIQTGTPQQLLFQPANDFVVDFIAAQRLQLELRTLSLHEIWDQLPEAKQNNIPALNSNLSLWDALEILTTSEQLLYVQHAEESNIKEASIQNIYAALNRLKKQY